MSRIQQNVSLKNTNVRPHLNISIGSIGPTGPVGSTGSTGTVGPTGTLNQVQIYMAIYPTGTEGGTLNANTWNVRPLNATGGGNLDGVYTSLAANTITFASGTYSVVGRTTSWLVGMTQLRLRDTTNNVTLGSGLTLSAGTGPENNGDAVTQEVYAIFSFTGSKNVQLQQNCAVTGATNGMGSSGAFNNREREVYAIVDILKMN